LSSFAPPSSLRSFRRSFPGKSMNLDKDHDPSRQKPSQPKGAVPGQTQAGSGDRRIVVHITI
jgi:hypothetical protein